LVHDILNLFVGTSHVAEMTTKPSSAVLSTSDITDQLTTTLDTPSTTSVLTSQGLSKEAATAQTVPFRMTTMKGELKKICVSYFLQNRASPSLGSSINIVRPVY
jgi:hypothetical protein